ncbi:MAG: energy transducer TonB [Lewinella sp.]
MLIFTFSGTAVLLGLGGLCLLIGLTILVLRSRLRKETVSNGKRVKHAAFSFSRPLHRLSLCVAIMASILAINWTEFSSETRIMGYTVEEDDLIEVAIPPTSHKPPPPPPPPPPVIEAVDEPEIEPEVFLNQDIEPDDPIIADLAPPPPVAPATPPPPPPPPAPEPVIDEGPLIFAERMPVFGQECFDLQGDERKVCSDRALLSFVQSRANYPALARENGIQGTVVVSFTVEKDGTISDVQAARKVAGGCTAAALKAVNAINKENAKFKPGIQGGLPVRVRYNLPVKFALQ